MNYIIQTDTKLYKKLNRLAKRRYGLPYDKLFFKDQDPENLDYSNVLFSEYANGGVAIKA